MTFMRASILLAGTASVAFSAWAQGLPPEGLKRDAWFYEMATKSDILDCQNTGYWMAATQGQTRTFASSEDRQKLDNCIQGARTKAQKQFNAFREKLKSEAARAALKEHYIVWLKTLDELRLQGGESEKPYFRRFEENERRMHDAWIRFEVESE